MKDRVLIVSVVLLSLICLTSVALAWQAMRQGQQINAALLAKLDSLGTSAAPAPQSFEFTDLKVKLVSDKTDEPIKGLRFSLAGKALSSTDSITLEETTGADGVASFGFVRPGEYILFFFGDRGTRRNQLIVRPGPTFEAVVKMPPPPGTAKLRFKYEFPSKIDSPDRPPYAAIRLRIPTPEQGGPTWKMEGTFMSREERDVLVILLNKEGQVRQLPEFIQKSMHSRRARTDSEFAKYIEMPDARFFVESVELLRIIEGESNEFELLARHQYEPNDRPVIELKDGQTLDFPLEIPQSVIVQAMAAMTPQAEAPAAARTVQPMDHRLLGIATYGRTVDLPVGRDGVVASVDVKENDRVKEGAMLMHLDVKLELEVVEKAGTQAERFRLERDAFVRAPFAGEVLKIHAHKDEHITKGATAVTLVSRDPLIAEMHLPVELMGELIEGEEYSFLAPPPIDRRLTARLKSIARQVEYATKTFRATFEIPNADLALPAGFGLRLEWPQPEAE